VRGGGLWSIGWGGYINNEKHDGHVLGYWQLKGHGVLYIINDLAQTDRFLGIEDQLLQGLKDWIAQL
jgi:hypothetical protein